jgi:hypothetical protein
MIFVGVDWSEAHHDVFVVDEEGKRLAEGRLPEGVEGIARFHELVGAHVDETYTTQLVPGAALPSSTLTNPLITALVDPSRRPLRRRHEQQRRGPRMCGQEMTLQPPRSREAVVSRSVTGRSRWGFQKRKGRPCNANSGFTPGAGTWRRPNFSPSNLDPQHRSPETLLEEV